MVIKSSRVKMLMFCILAGGLAWVCSYIVNGDFQFVSGRAAGKVNFAFLIFSALTVFAFFGFVFGGRVRARLSVEGFYAPKISKQLIPWGEIQDISVRKMNMGEVIVFNLVPGSVSEQNAKVSAKAGKQIVKLSGFQGYTIPLSTTGVSGEKFMESLNQFMTSGQTDMRKAFSPSQFNNGTSGFGNTRTNFGQRGSAL